MGYKHQNGTAALSVSMDKAVAEKLRALCEANRRRISDVVAKLCEDLVNGTITYPDLARPDFGALTAAPPPPVNQRAPAYFAPPAPAYIASPVQAPAPQQPINLHAVTDLLPDANERDVLKSRYDFVVYLLNTLANRPADAAKLNPELVNHKAADVLLPNFPEARGWNYQERQVLERRAQTAFERGFYGTYLSGPFVGGLLEISEELSQ